MKVINKLNVKKLLLIINDVDDVTDMPLVESDHHDKLLPDLKYIIKHSMK